MGQTVILCLDFLRTIRLFSKAPFSPLLTCLGTLVENNQLTINVSIYSLSLYVYIYTYTWLEFTVGCPC